MCPLGYTAAANACGGTSSAVQITFDKSQKNWANGGVTFNAGLRSAPDESIEPFTYNHRGAYFNGSDKLYTSDSSAPVYLHSDLSVTAWIYSTSVTGSVFSKSYSDYSTITSADLFDIHLASGHIDFIINETNRATKVTT